MHALLPAARGAAMRWKQMKMRWRRMRSKQRYFEKAAEPTGYNKIIINGRINDRGKIKKVK